MADDDTPKQPPSLEADDRPDATPKPEPEVHPEALRAEPPQPDASLEKALIFNEEFGKGYEIEIVEETDD